MRIHRHNISFLLLVLIIAIPCLCAGKEYWQQYVHYEIAANLNSHAHLIEAQERLIYQNNSPDTLSELYFHLYPNAFQKNSTMATEASAALINIIDSPENLGRIKIDSLSIIKPLAHQPGSFDTLIVDTILKIKLASPLLPGEQLSIAMKFVTKIREYNPAGGKGGYRNNLYEVSQWYPKVCVYDERGWHPIPYHWLGEFYGEFGTFDVTLNVPDSFIVAATGEVVSGDPGWNSVLIDSNGNLISLPHLTLQNSEHHDRSSWRRTVTFHAEQVHDFVWAASPDYRYQTAVCQNIPIHVLFQKSSQRQWLNMALKQSEQALNWLIGLIGAYPYPQLTVCQGALPGGMEYPMVAMLGNVDFTLIVHEISHQYIYGAVANNEQAEGWLDEGLVTYISEFLVQENLPDRVSKMTPTIPIRTKFIKKQFGFCELDDVKLNSLYYYFFSGYEKPVATPYSELGNLYLYSYNVYLKPSKIFAMLDYLVGRENFKKILQVYYEQWQFKHVDGEKFKVVCEQVSGMNLGWFFQQWIYQTKRIDYACTNVTSQKQPTGDWKADFTIKRLDEGIMPVDLEVVTQTGDTACQRWDGAERETTITFSTHSKIQNYQLDPDDVILDQNRLNNSKLRIKPFFYPDFPSMYYLPRNAYALFWWPQVWYNDLDGLKIGVKFSGGYLNRYYILRNNLWYSCSSNHVDFSFSYSMPWESINKNLWRHFSVSKIEGRTEINLNINYLRNKQFAGNQTLDFKWGFVHQHLDDDRYAYRNIKSDGHIIKIQEWDKGDVNKFYLSYRTNSLDFLPQSSVEFNGQISNKAWQSDFNYIRLSLQHQAALGSVKRNWKVNIRNFTGYCYRQNDPIPIQDLFGVAEANPNQRFGYFYLRSIGSLPAGMNYHLPGDGNLRGYLNKVIGGNSALAADKLVGVNLEFYHRKFHYLLPKKFRGLFQGIDFSLFLDGGRVWRNGLNSQYLFDAGVGLHFYQMILGKQRILRVEFPLWLSQPELDKYSPSESSWKFRWIISLQ